VFSAVKFPIRVFRGLTLRKFLLSAFVFLLFLALLLPASFWFAPKLLVVQNRPILAEVIIVLGGENFHRPERAAELFQKHFSPRVIVTGTNDAKEIRLGLMVKGVPSDVIELEEKARTTFENAQYTVELLRAEKVKRAILVTSWFHSRRALRCFEKAAPDIQFISCPSSAGMEPSLWPSNDERLRTFIFKEYLKTVVYWIYH
jgi:uncharacterized SAM-binding protein YcdF (DUF218 family)